MLHRTVRFSFFLVSLPSLLFPQLHCWDLLWNLSNFYSFSTKFPQCRSEDGWGKSQQTWKLPSSLSLAFSSAGFLWFHHLHVSTNPPVFGLCLFPSGTPGNWEHRLGDKEGNRARTDRERHDCHGNNRKKQTVAWRGGDSVRWPLGSPQMLLDPGACGKARDAYPLAPTHGGPLSLSPWQHPESSRINHTLVAWHLSPPAWPTAQHDMIKRP